MNSELKTISIDLLKAGDVILCYSGGDVLTKISNSGKKIISHNLSLEYTHAALCIGAQSAVESIRDGGVRKVGIADLISRYKHVVVLRHPDMWDLNTCQILNDFVEKVIANKAGYNIWDLCNFRKGGKRDKDSRSVCDRLTAYHKGEYAPSSPYKDRYFCSELVVACFIAAGCIDESAAVFYEPSCISPDDLSNDPTFGTFCGYIIGDDKNYIVSSSDRFYRQTSFAEIFG